MNKPATKETYIRQFFFIIKILQAPLFISFLAFFVLAFPEQVHEVYRILAENISYSLEKEGLAFVRQETTGHLFISFLALGVMCFVIWYVARHLTDVLSPVETRNTVMKRRSLRWGPRFLGALPAIGAAIGQVLAQPIREEETLVTVLNRYYLLTEEQNQTTAFLVQQLLDRVTVLLFWGSLICVIGALFLFLMTYLRTRRLGLDYVSADEWLFSNSLHSVLFIIFLAFVSAIFIFSPLKVPQVIGSVAIFCLFISMLMFVVGQINYLSYRWGVPIFTLIIVFTLIISYSELNDNHTVRHVDGRVQQQAADIQALDAPEEIEQFETWLTSRQDLAAYDGKDYPIYIIASQGGGLYAAYHSAMFLARMQDICPNFSQHVFAISGVSGGSLGASVFAGLAKNIATNTKAKKCTVLKRDEDGAPIAGKFETLTKKILDQDFLSPLMFRTFFPDFLQRFLPYPFPALDRARGLEHNFERAWEVGVKSELKLKGAKNPFKDHVLTMWQATDAAPALLLNTTEAETGLQWIIAPFKIETEGFQNFPLWDSIAPEKSGDDTEEVNRRDDKKIDAKSQAIRLPLSQAISLSARFPVITPAGSVSITYGGKLTQKARLVDGGYFENSGVATSLELINKLKDRLEAIREKIVSEQNINIKKFTLNLIVMTNRDLGEEANISRSKGLGELMSPVRALLNTRSIRAHIAVAQAKRELDRNEQERINQGQGRMARVREVNFSTIHHQIPLGWYLSSLSQDTIDQQLGLHSRCEKPDLNFQIKDAPPNSSGAITQLNADCVQRSIMHELNHELDDELQKLALAFQLEKQQQQIILDQGFEKQKELEDKGRVNFIKRKGFYQCVTSNFHKSGLNFDQTAGYESFLDVWEEKPDRYKDKRWLAYALATIYHETGRTMAPERECRAKTDKEAIACVTRVYKRGRIRRNYAQIDSKTGHAYFGRGYVGLTWAYNYKRMGKALNIGDQLYQNPSLALEPKIAAQIVIEGMIQGLFTGKRLSQYFNKSTTDWGNARRIVNGLDKYKLVGGYARRYYQCLTHPYARKSASSMKKK